MTVNTKPRQRCTVNKRFNHTISYNKINIKKLRKSVVFEINILIKPNINNDD
jgi:hypothetical protein